jgi:hypothetical protein
MSQSYQASQQQGGQMVSSQPAQASGGAIPDLLRIGSIPSNTNIEVETAVLEPVTHSDTHCKFVLQNKGLLHSHSKLEFEFNCPTGLAGNVVPASLPVGIGIHSLIQRATLRVGTKTVCEIDDYNHYQTYRSAFLSPEAEIEREQILTGRNGNCLEFDYINRKQIAPAGANQFQYGSDTQSNTSADGLMLANGKDMDVAVTNPNLDGASQRPELDEVRLTRATGAAATVQDLCPTWQIAISDLFPFLKFNQLPLYMMKEPVNLELVFSKAGLATTMDCERACARDTRNPVVTIKTASTRMIADHIFYPQEMMEAYANANRSLQFQYTDYRLSKFSVTHATLASQGIRNVGGAGRIISKVIWGIEESNLDASYIQNKYAAIAPTRVYTNNGGGAQLGNSQGSATFNVKMNEQFLFPVDVSNSARHFHNVVQSEGSVPFLSREVYSNEGVSLALGVYNPDVMTPANGGLDNFGSGLTPAGVVSAGVGGQYPGTQFWNAVRLNRGERVNSRGIELYFKSGQNAAMGAGSIQRVWLETLRTATLQDGELTCYYS